MTTLNLGLAFFAILYAGGLAFYAYRGEWTAALAWLVLLPCAQWVSLRLFPVTSKWRGYGSLDDKLPASVPRACVQVTLYSHTNCPFCPIVKRRLDALQKEMDFTLTKVDLSFKPQVAASKGIRSVPVVEVGNQRLVGNATTEQLARLIAGPQASGRSAVVKVL